MGTLPIGLVRTVVFSSSSCNLLCIYPQKKKKKKTAGIIFHLMMYLGLFRDVQSHGAQFY